MILCARSGAVVDGQDIGELARLELADRSVNLRVALQRRLGHKSHIAAIGSGVRIFREVHGHGAEIFAAFKPVVQDLDLLFGVGVAGGLVVLQVAGLLRGSVVTTICASW